MLFRKFLPCLNQRERGPQRFGCLGEWRLVRTLMLITKSITVLSAPSTSPQSHWKSMERLHWRPKANHSPFSYLRQDLSLNLSSDSASLGFLTFVPSHPLSLTPHPLTLGPIPLGFQAWVAITSFMWMLWIWAPVLIFAQKALDPTEPSADPTTEKCFNPTFCEGELRIQRQWVDHDGKASMKGRHASWFKAPSCLLCLPWGPHPIQKTKTQNSDWLSYSALSLDLPNGPKN